MAIKRNYFSWRKMMFEKFINETTVLFNLEVLETVNLPCLFFFSFGQMRAMMSYAGTRLYQTLCTCNNNHYFKIPVSINYRTTKLGGLAKKFLVSSSRRDSSLFPDHLFIGMWSSDVFRLKESKCPSGSMNSPVVSRWAASGCQSFCYY